ncbi:MAG: hypothetical protein M5R40_12640 [Anaerolineae bacterium]|nr:hypothetical protein [Anaerolineae bacterium]
MMATIAASLEAYLRRVVVPIRLACLTESGWPLVVSLWYLYRDGQLFCATRSTARVVAYLRHAPRCGFEVAADQPPYCGVRGYGVATIDEAMGPEILEALLVRYLGDLDKPLAQRLLAQGAREVAIVIAPVRVFTWNYTERMRDSVPGALDKPCPE